MECFNFLIFNSLRCLGFVFENRRWDYYNLSNCYYLKFSGHFILLELVDSFCHEINDWKVLISSVFKWKKIDFQKRDRAHWPTSIEFSLEFSWANLNFQFAYTNTLNRICTFFFENLIALHSFIVIIYFLKHLLNHSIWFYQ